MKCDYSISTIRDYLSKHLKIGVGGKFLNQNDGESFISSLFDEMIDSKLKNEETPKIWVNYLFKDFRNFILKNTDKVQYDLLQEKFIQTELFDFQFYNPYKRKDNLLIQLFNEMQITKNEKYNIMQFSIDNFALPFENTFTIIENNPLILKSLFASQSKEDVFKYDLIMFVNNRFLQDVGVTYFTLDTQNKKIYMDKSQERQIIFPIDDGNYKEIIHNTFTPDFAKFIYTFNKLSSRKIVSDTPKNEKDYFNFKDKNRTTVRVTNKPIYYILDEKEDIETEKRKIKSLGRLEFTHAFKVRGHWRKIDDKSIGKDRSGDYNVQGYTWVIDHIRGEGELVKRVRIVK